MAITYVGLFVALGTLLAMRWLARVERRRAGIVLGEPIAERYRPLSAAPRCGRRACTSSSARARRGVTSRGRPRGAGSGRSLATLAVGAVGRRARAGRAAGLVLVDPRRRRPRLFAADNSRSRSPPTAIGLLLVPVCGCARARPSPSCSSRRCASCCARAGRPRRPRGFARAAAPAAFGPSFELHVSLSLLAGLVVTIIWLATGGYFWPVWVWSGARRSARAARRRSARGRAGGARRPLGRFAIQAELSRSSRSSSTRRLGAVGFRQGSGRSGRCSAGTALALHALIVYRDRLPWRAAALVSASTC